MSELQALKDAKKTLEQIKNRNRKIVKWEGEDAAFKNFEPTYSFSNENLKDYYKLFNIKNGDILTVSGSGDQVLNAVLNGCKSVDCFDSNTLSYYNLMLKINAIKYLDINDFLKLYSLLKPVDTRKNYYLKFNDLMENDIKIFWDFIFSKKGDLFRECFINKTSSLDNIAYLDSKNYEILKRSPYNITFSNTDVFELPNIYQKKYDFINLSNICDYINDTDKFIELINKLKINNLKNNGSILIAYSWRRPYSYSITNYISDSLEAKQIRINDTSDDSIMVYKKTI